MLKLYELKQNDEFKDLIDEEKKQAQDALRASGDVSDRGSATDYSDSDISSDQDDEPDLATSYNDLDFYVKEKEIFKPKKKYAKKAGKAKYLRNLERELIELRGQEQSYL